MTDSSPLSHKIALQSRRFLDRLAVFQEWQFPFRSFGIRRIKDRQRKQIRVDLARDDILLRCGRPAEFCPIPGCPTLATPFATKSKTSRQSHPSLSMAQCSTNRGRSEIRASPEILAGLLQGVSPRVRLEVPAGSTCSRNL